MLRLDEYADDLANQVSVVLPLKRKEMDYQGQIIDESWQVAFVEAILNSMCGIGSYRLNPVVQPDQQVR